MPFYLINTNLGVGGQGEMFLIFIFLKYVKKKRFVGGEEWVEEAFYSKSRTHL